MKRHWFLRFGLPLMALGMFAFAVNSVLTKPNYAKAEPAIAPAESPYNAPIAGVGITEPKSEAIAIGTPIAGVVASVAVQVGDQVQKGDRLFALDTRDAQARLMAAKARVASAHAAAADASFQLRLYQGVKDARAISRDELNRRKFAAARANADVATARAEVRTVETELERLVVRAPMDAQVLRVNVRPGEFATAGVLAKPLMVLGDMSRMHVRVEVDETEALGVKPDATAQGVLRGYGEQKIPLQFVRKEVLLQPKRSITGDGNERVDTRVQEVIYSFDNAEIQAAIGQQMDVFIDGGVHGDSTERAPVRADFTHKAGQ